MNKILLKLLLIVIISASYSYGNSISEEKSFRCEYVDNTPAEENACDSDSSCDIAYYSIGNDSSGNVLNAKIGVDSPNPDGVDYSHMLICKSDLEVELDFEFKYGPDRCEESQFEFGFLNQKFNSKISANYNSSNYNISICLMTSNTQFGSLDIKIENEETSNLDSIGFDCLYRVSNDPILNGYNAKISSCDANFTNALNVVEQYSYVVYGRLTPNVESSTCNQDCTSTVDGRIYQACGDTIQSCQGIPAKCDGSLVGQWVSFDMDRDLLCEKPFDRFRQTSKSSESISVTSQDEGCSNIIVEKYSVRIDGEPTTMNIYVCEE